MSLKLAVGCALVLFLLSVGIILATGLTQSAVDKSNLQNDIVLVKRDDVSGLGIQIVVTNTSADQISTITDQLNQTPVQTPVINTTQPNITQPNQTPAPQPIVTPTPDPQPTPTVVDTPAPAIVDQTPIYYPPPRRTRAS